MGPKKNIDITAWYEKYGPMVIRRCQSILRNTDDALDAVQDVFLNLIKSEARLKENYPSCLLYTMATNVCLNRLRQKKRESTAFFSGVEESLFCFDEGFSQVEAELLLEDILSNESESDRSIYFMYHVDGMTLKEIGEAVGLSFSGVRKRLEAFKNRVCLRLRNGEDL